jgi:hypothetical protein
MVDAGADVTADVAADSSSQPEASADAPIAIDSSSACTMMTCRGTVTIQPGQMVPVGDTCGDGCKFDGPICSCSVQATCPCSDAGPCSVTAGCNFDATNAMYCQPDYPNFYDCSTGPTPPCCLKLNLMGPPGHMALCCQ